MKDLKQKLKMSRKMMWTWMKDTVKDPLTFLIFSVIWIFLASPAIFGITAYVVTKQERWLILAGSWIAFTAPPLPLPVTPLSIIGAIGLRQVIRRAGKKRKLKKEEQKRVRECEKLGKEGLDCQEIATLDLIDIYTTNFEEVSEKELVARKQNKSSQVDARNAEEQRIVLTEKAGFLDDEKIVEEDALEDKT